MVTTTITKHELSLILILSKNSLTKLLSSSYILNVPELIIFLTGDLVK